MTTENLQVAHVLEQWKNRPHNKYASQLKVKELIEIGEHYNNLKSSLKGNKFNSDLYNTHKVSEEWRLEGLVGIVRHNLNDIFEKHTVFSYSELVNQHKIWKKDKQGAKKHTGNRSDFKTGFKDFLSLCSETLNSINPQFLPFRNELPIGRRTVFPSLKKIFDSIEANCSNDEEVSAQMHQAFLSHLHDLTIDPKWVAAIKAHPLSAQQKQKADSLLQSTDFRGSAMSPATHFEGPATATLLEGSATSPATLASPREKIKTASAATLDRQFNEMTECMQMMQIVKHRVKNPVNTVHDEGVQKLIKTTHNLQPRIVELTESDDPEHMICDNDPAPVPQEGENVKNNFEYDGDVEFGGECNVSQQMPTFDCIATTPPSQRNSASMIATDVALEQQVSCTLNVDSSHSAIKSISLSEYNGVYCDVSDDMVDYDYEEESSANGGPSTSAYSGPYTSAYGGVGTSAYGGAGTHFELKRNNIWNRFEHTASDSNSVDVSVKSSAENMDIEQLSDKEGGEATTDNLHGLEGVVAAVAACAQHISELKAPVVPTPQTTTLSQQLFEMAQAVVIDRAMDVVLDQRDKVRKHSEQCYWDEKEVIRNRAIRHFQKIQFVEQYHRDPDESEMTTKLLVPSFQYQLSSEEAKFYETLHVTQPDMQCTVVTLFGCRATTSGVYDCWNSLQTVLFGDRNLFKQFGFVLKVMELPPKELTDLYQLAICGNKVPRKTALCVVNPTIKSNLRYIMASEMCTKIRGLLESLFVGFCTRMADASIVALFRETRYKGCPVNIHTFVRFIRDGFVDNIEVQPGVKLDEYSYYLRCYDFERSVRRNSFHDNSKWATARDKTKSIVKLNLECAHGFMRGYMFRPYGFNSCPYPGFDDELHKLVCKVFCVLTGRRVQVHTDLGNKPQVETYLPKTPTDKSHKDGDKVPPVILIGKSDSLHNHVEQWCTLLANKKK